jgi:carboxypeptidase C (cathepsin A)
MTHFSGFSFSNKLPETQADVGTNLYNMLQQWFTLFPMYQENPFYPFGESYAGKFVPTIGRKIHEENQVEGNIR